ncbi:hypothetical protein [Pontibacter actiniarum]|uniref:DUF4177 domain-containing protein n=1 Tax=Pontibacter actiniarum TaxID=323450 RepID=A0A1X9YPF7_9BACT|nr:hypothetical protein [Pontibacter actiniarum]ARS34749.1 hypothetical protein CA264_04440 [Pontibacter actiniarum]
MKQTLVLLLLAFGLNLTAQAQGQAPAEPPGQVNSQTYEYVKVFVQSKLIRNGYTANLINGRSDDGNSIVDATGKTQEFSSTEAILNHLGSQGWEFVAYVPDDEGKLSPRRYLMRRLTNSPL